MGHRGGEKARAEIERVAPTSGPGASEREGDARAAKHVVRKGEAARRAQVRPLGRSAGRALLGRAGRWGERVTRPAVRAEGELGCSVSLLGRGGKRSWAGLGCFWGLGFFPFSFPFLFQTRSILNEFKSNLNSNPMHSIK